MNSVIDAFVTQYKSIGEKWWRLLPSYLATFNLKNAIVAYESSKVEQSRRRYLSLIAESLEVVRAAHFPASKVFFKYYNSLPGSGDMISFLENSYVKAFNLLLDESISETFAMIGFSYINDVPAELINDLLLNMQILFNKGLWNTNSLRVLLSANGYEVMNAQLWSNKTCCLLELYAENGIDPDSDEHVYFINEYYLTHIEQKTLLTTKQIMTQAKTPEGIFDGLMDGIQTDGGPPRLSPTLDEVEQKPSQNGHGFLWGLCGFMDKGQLVVQETKDSDAGLDFRGMYDKDGSLVL